MPHDQDLELGHIPADLSFAMHLCGGMTVLLSVPSAAVICGFLKPQITAAHG
jgi:hypothetical protein